jgi:PAS domain S-box-containing protein
VWSKSAGVQAREDASAGKPARDFPATFRRLVYKRRVSQIGSIDQPPRAPAAVPWPKLAGFGLGYFLCAWLGRILSGSGETVVSYWLPGGLFVSALLLNETRDWPGLMLSAVAANTLFDLLHDPNPSLGVIALFCVSNVAAAGSGAWLVRRFVAAKPALRSLREFFGVLFLAGGVGTAIGATIAAAMLTEFRVANSFASEWRIIWSGEMMAVLVVAPCLFAFLGPTLKMPPGYFTWPRVVEVILIVGGMAFYLWRVLVQGGGINSPKAPALVFVLWAGVRFGLRGGALATLLLALWVAFLTTHYLRGLSAEEVATGQYMITLQVFVAMAVLLGLVPAIVLDERDRVMASLGESEQKFAKAFRTGPDVMSLADLETGRYLEVNEAHEKTFGFKREEVLGRAPVELGMLEHPEQREAIFAQLRATGSVRDVELQVRNRRGEPMTVLHSAEVLELGGRKCVLRISHDITARKRAEAEREQAVAREQAARIEYTLRLIAAQEAEHKRIAAELHDSMGQNLLLIKNLAEMSLRASAPEPIQEHAATIKQLAGECIAEARRISRDLHPPQLDHLGLQRALQSMLEQIAQASRIEFTSKFEAVDELFPQEAAINLYRIVQECLNNILKHSQASRVNLRLERDVHEVLLRIEDDGVGFDALSGGSKGLGLRNITERVRMLGGKLSVASSPGEGTSIEITIPVAEPPAAAA